MLPPKQKSRYMVLKKYDLISDPSDNHLLFGGRFGGLNVYAYS